MGVRHIIEAAFNVRIDHPPLPSSGVGEQGNFGTGVMAPPAWTESITGLLESGFPEGVKRVLDAGLQAAIENSRDTERAEFSGRFGDVHTACGLRAPGLRCGQEVHEAPPSLGGLNDYLIDARRVLSRILLRHPAHAEERVGVAAQQQFLECMDFA
jgi:hypothetical protein